MLYNGATSLWETSTGASDMDGSGSLCHGWSAISLTFTGRYLLGVQPLEPGFSVCQIKIYPSHLDSAAGTVPTPFGSIEVKWRKHSDNTLSVEVAAPEKCELKTAEYEWPWYGQLMRVPQTFAWLLQVDFWLKQYNPERIS